MNRAIWWHNEAFAAEEAIVVPASPFDQAGIRGDYARNGAVFGTLVGAGLGLAVTSEAGAGVGPGVFGTLAFAAAGGVLGRFVGASISR